MLSFSKNKKGSVSIAIMVLGVLFLFTGILSILSMGSLKVSGNFDDALWYGRVYANESSLENSLYFILVESFLNNYQVVLKDYSEKIGHDNVNLNEIFREKVTGTKVENFGDGVLFSFDGEDMQRVGAVGDFFRGNNAVYSFDGKSARVRAENWRTNISRVDSDGNVLLRVNYSSMINADVSFQMLGLLSLDDIVGIYCECLRSSSSDAAKICFENKFSDFDVSFEDVALQGFSSISAQPTPPTYVSGDTGSNVNVVSSLSGYAKPVSILAKLTSKDRYYINKEMKKLEFSLAFNYFEEGKSSTNLAFCPSGAETMIISS